jgi:UDP-N-acetylglucosamine 1-carboxyvinyltransferase
MNNDDYKAKIGSLIQEARVSRGLTQTELAKELGTSQSAVNRIEKGGQNISLEMIARISDVLSSNIVTLNQSVKINFRINGGKKLTGSI